MSRSTAYGPVSISFHWAIAVLLLGQIALGFSMERVKSMALQFELIQWHKSFGFVILGLATLRLLWRAVTGPAPAAPGLSPAERWAAWAVQGMLLALTIAVPLAGWALASASTLNIPSFAFNLVVVPHLPLAPSAGAEAFWRQAHGVLAYATLVLALGHAGAALRHHLILGDGVLARMIPGLSWRGRTDLIDGRNDDA